jgi:signal transduction histidine kinase
MNGQTGRPSIIEGLNLLAKQSINQKEVEHTMQQIHSNSTETEALLLVIGTSVHELNQPMTVVLGLSELLLSEADPGSPLATDLDTITKEIRHMNEILRGLSLLAHYQTPSLVDSTN